MRFTVCDMPLTSTWPTPKNFSNGVFSLRTDVFRLHYVGEFKNAIITGRSSFVFDENSVREITIFS